MIGTRKRENNLPTVFRGNPSSYFSFKMIGKLGFKSVKSSKLSLHQTSGLSFQSRIVFWYVSLLILSSMMSSSLACFYYSISDQERDDDGSSFLEALVNLIRRKQTLGQSNSNNNLQLPPQDKRGCIRRNAPCTGRPLDCCAGSACQCSVFNRCFCQRKGIFQTLY